MEISRRRLWTGRVISGVVSALFLFSGAMKLKGGPELSQGMSQLQLPDSMVLPLAMLELFVVIV